MNTETESNVMPLLAGLHALRHSLDTSTSTSEALRLIQEGLKLVDGHQQWSRAPEKFAQIKAYLNEGDQKAFEKSLADLTQKVCESAPRFRVVLVNQTALWQDEQLTEAAGEIWAAYLYDENRRADMGDIRPSYEMCHLYNTARNQMADNFNALLLKSDNNAISMYCSYVDKMSWNCRHFCGEPVNPGAANYQELQQSEIEYYKKNIQIGLPQPINLLMVLKATAQQLIGGDDLGAVSALKTLAATPCAQHHQTMLFEAAESYQRSCNRAELERAILKITSEETNFQENHLLTDDAPSP